MKYLLRSIKYFIMISLLLGAILATLVLLDLSAGDPSEMFRNGWTSVWQIALLFAVFSAIYPKFGYTDREVGIPGEFAEIRDGIVEYMEARGFRLESEEGENMSFRLRSKVNALAKMYEDRVTMTRILGGYSLEGITKEVNRLASGLEYKFKREPFED